MLTRRHIRIKVVQSVYAFHQSETPDIEKQEKFLLYSIEQMEDLYLLMLQLLIDVQRHAENYMLRSQNKHLATQEEKNPSKKERKSVEWGKRVGGRVVDGVHRPYHKQKRTE